jgi:hypothetical protein
LDDGITELEKSALSRSWLAVIALALEQCHTASVASAAGSHRNVHNTKKKAKYF